ncbi:MAG: hypothetical protein L6V93_10255 [Clostridiales bacterium]|nr:MAG: hypothetical protein L6V93_10255 [Clostridiales bacterium]
MMIGPASCYYSDNSDSFELGNTSPDLWLDVNLPHDYIIEQTPSKEKSAGARIF